MRGCGFDRCVAFRKYSNKGRFNKLRTLMKSVALSEVAEEADPYAPPKPALSSSVHTMACPWCVASFLPGELGFGKETDYVVTTLCSLAVVACDSQGRKMDS